MEKLERNVDMQIRRYINGRPSKVSWETRLWLDRLRGHAETDWKQQLTGASGEVLVKLALVPHAERIEHIKAHLRNNSSNKYEYVGCLMSHEYDSHAVLTELIFAVTQQNVYAGGNWK